MSLDLSTIRLPPPGVQLRIPPENLREPEYEEKHQQVRRHLKDDGDDAEMCDLMKAQVRAFQAARHQTDAND